LDAFNVVNAKKCSQVLECTWKVTILTGANLRRSLAAKQNMTKTLPCSACAIFNGQQNNEKNPGFNFYIIVKMDFADKIVTNFEFVVNVFVHNKLMFC
jgi:hypothetical protein